MDTPLYQIYCSHLKWFQVYTFWRPNNKNGFRSSKTANRHCHPLNCFKATERHNRDNQPVWKFTFFFRTDTYNAAAAQSVPQPLICHLCGHKGWVSKAINCFFSAPRKIEGVSHIPWTEDIRGLTGLARHLFSYLKNKSLGWMEKSLQFVLFDPF